MKPTRLYSASNMNVIYLLGGIAGLAAALLFRRNLAAEYHLLHLLGFFPNGPSNVLNDPLEWFVLIHTNPGTALLLLNFYDVVNVTLVMFLTIALFFLFNNGRRELRILSVVSSALCAGLYIANDVSFSMLSLSRQYFLQESPQGMQRLATAAHALFADHAADGLSGSTAFYLRLFFLYFSGLLMSQVMLSSRLFKNISGWIGIIGHAAGLCYFIVIFFNPLLVAIPIAVSAPFLLAWYIICSVKLLRKYRGKQEESDVPKSQVSGEEQ